MTDNKKIAIFDIDGTIFRKNLHFELINELVWMKVFPHSARKKLVSLYTDWLERKGTYETYRLELVDLYAKHIKGCSVSDIETASHGVVSFHKDRTYAFAEEIMEKLKKEDYKIIAISGSPIEIVKEFNRQHLGFDEAFGTVYEFSEEGIYTGEEVSAPVHDKGSAMREYLDSNGYALEGSYGVGDTESDASFLRMVENPIAFNPNSNLKEIAEKNGWRVVVEKKDVIYDIR